MLVFPCKILQLSSRHLLACPNEKKILEGNVTKATLFDPAT